MFWPHELIQIFSPPAEDALLRGQLPALRSPLWRVQVPLARFVEQPRRCAAPRCALPTKLGTTTIGTRSAWTFCWWRPTPPSLRRPTWSPKSSTRFNSDAQRVTLGSWVWERYSTNGAHGRAAWAAEGSCQFLSSRAFTQALSGGDPGQPGEKKELEHIGRFAAGWRAIVQALSSLGQPASIVGILQGAWGCVVPASLGGSHAGSVEYVGRRFRKVDIMTEEDPLGWPQHLFALRNLAILLGCSAMASGGKGYYAAQAAASSSSGGDPAPGWRAADSLLMIAAQRARQWRESEGLLDDNDFAYAYTDYDQVVGLAGHHVADDWLQTRARVEEELLAAGAKVVEDNPKGSVTLRPVRKTIYKKKPKAINVDKNISEAVQKRVTGLVSMLIGMGSYKPLTDALKAEWKQTCRRVAEKKVKEAETEW